MAEIIENPRCNRNATEDCAIVGVGNREKMLESGYQQGGKKMEVSFLGSVVFGVVLLIGLAVLITLLVLGIVLIKALIRHIKSKEVRAEKAVIKKSLGEVLKQHREECKMTQEFVAEAIGVSRQAVSKWENGVSQN